MELAMADMIPQMSGPPKWPAFNALRHLNRAWALRQSDPEMMAFRCITAEEEAATALFRSLQRRKYRNAEKLKPRHHVHKNAVTPFLAAVRHVIAGSGGAELPETQIFLNQTRLPWMFEVKIKVGVLPDGRNLWAKSLPLHFGLTRIVNGAEAPIDFHEQMRHVAAEANAKSVTKYLVERANLRNRLLYAASDGYTKMLGEVEKIFVYYKRNTFAILQLYLMIDPHDKHQMFVQHCLDTFLNIIGGAPNERIFK
jgi:hypothetical protein